MARPRIHDESVRKQLLEVSSEIIATQGDDALSMRKVSKAAGTTTAAIYSLFGSREALIEAVVVEGFTRFAEHLQAVPHTDDPAADLLALGEAYRANALHNPHYYRIMFNDTYGPNTSEHTDKTFDMLVAAIHRATRCDVTAAHRRAQRLWAYIHGLVSLELAGLLDVDEDPAAAQASFSAALRAAKSLIWEAADDPR